MSMIIRLDVYVVVCDSNAWWNVVEKVLQHWTPQRTQLKTRTSVRKTDKEWEWETEKERESKNERMRKTGWLDDEKSILITWLPLLLPIKSDFRNSEFFYVNSLEIQCKCQYVSKLKHNWMKLSYFISEHIIITKCYTIYVTIVSGIHTHSHTHAHTNI